MFLYSAPKEDLRACGGDGRRDRRSASLVETIAVVGRAVENGRSVGGGRGEVVDLRGARSRVFWGGGGGVSS